MAKRTAKFACAILVGLVGSTLLTLLPRVTPAAADDCLTEPSSEKVDGQHWFYRSEHGRRCWYLKDTTGSAKDITRDSAPRQQSSSSQASSAWDFAQPTPPKLAPRRADDTARAQPATGTPSVVRAQPAATSFDDNLQKEMPAAPWKRIEYWRHAPAVHSPASNCVPNGRFRFAPRRQREPRPSWRRSNYE